MRPSQISSENGRNHGSWEVKLEIMTDRPTPSNNRDREADRPGHREVLLPITDSCT